MEHRWGKRFNVDISVRLKLHDGLLRPARITNLSISGALIRGHCHLPALRQLEVVIGDESVPACVIRHVAGGFSVEWRDLAPEPVLGLLHAATRGAHPVAARHRLTASSP